MEPTTPVMADRRVDIHTDGLRDLRRLGLTGSLLLAIGAFGAGALPMPNPLGGLRLVGLPARNPTISLAAAYAGLVLLVLAWGRVLLRLHRPGAPSRRALRRTAVTWILPLALAPPLFSRDVYSYLAQGAVLAHGLDPYRLGPAPALGISDPLVRSIPAIWRDTPAVYTCLAFATGLDMSWLTVLEVPGSVVSFLSVATDIGIVATALGVAVGLGAHLETDLALLHEAGIVTAVALLARTLYGCFSRYRDPLASLAVGMAVVAVLAVQTQPWYLLWALIPAAATPRPTLHRALGWGCVALALLIPPTGGDFLFRGFQLDNALVAAALLVTAALAMAHLRSPASAVAHDAPASDQGAQLLAVPASSAAVASTQNSLPSGSASTAHPF